MNDLVGRIKQALDYANYSWSRAAIEIGLSAQAAQKWKVGKISKETIQKLAVLTKINSGWLLDGTGEMKSFGESEQNSLLGSASEENLIPITGILHFDKDDLWTTSESINDGFVSSTACSKYAYAQYIKGLGLHNAIRNGWLIVCDPKAKLLAGEFVLISQGNNKTIGEFLFESNDSWNIQSLHNNERIILQKKETTLTAILAILPPSRSKKNLQN